MATTQTTRRKTAATNRSTTAKKAAATRARRSTATQAKRTRASVKRSTTGAGHRADKAAAQGELGLATVNNAVQGAVGAGFRLAGSALSAVRKAL
jgi:hypothetical protein